MQGMSASATGTDYTPTQHAASPPVTVVLTVLLLVFFFVGFFSIYFCKCFMDHILTSFQRSPSGDLVGTAVVPKEGLDFSYIQSFPTFKYASVKDFRIEKYGLECAICLVEFEDDSMLRLLTACCHVFHKECIDLWLESHKTCPFCRENLESSGNLADKSPVLARENNAMHDIHEGNEAVFLGDSDAVHIDIEDEEGAQLHLNSTSTSPSPNPNPNSSTQNEKHKNVDAVIVAVTEDEQSSSTQDQEYKQRVENETERFSRSHSTGHSIVRPRTDEDKYTLRLPEQVKIKLLRGHHNWTGSCTTFGEFSRQNHNAAAGAHFGEASGFAAPGGGQDIHKL